MKRINLVCLIIFIFSCNKTENEKFNTNFDLNYIDEFSFSTPYEPLNLSKSKLNLRGKIKSIIVSQKDEHRKTNTIVRKLYFNRNGTLKEYEYDRSYHDRKYKYEYSKNNQLTEILISRKDKNRDEPLEKVLFSYQDKLENIDFYFYLNYKKNWVLSKKNKIYFKNNKPEKKHFLKSSENDEFEEIGISYFTYNLNDTLSIQKNYTKNKLCFTQKEIKYDSLIIKENKFYGFCSIKNDSKTELHIENNKVIKKTVYYDNNKIYTYNGKNEILSIKDVFNKKLQTNFSYKYDSKNNWIEKTAQIKEYQDVTKKKLNDYKIIETRKIKYY